MRMLLMLLTIGLFGILVMQLLFKQEQEAHGNIQATAQDILEHNKEADIFQYNDHVYINVESMENIKTNDFQKGPRIGRIIHQSRDVETFTNGSATQLPEGTVIYQTVGEGLSILTIERNGKELIYMALLEDDFLQD